MKIIVGVLFIFLDIVLMPFYILRYIALSLILLYGSIRFESDIRKEFKDFNEITINEIKHLLGMQVGILKGSRNS